MHFMHPTTQSTQWVGHRLLQICWYLDGCVSMFWIWLCLWSWQPEGNL